LIGRFRFISAHRLVYGVKRLCRVLNVGRSAFYAWLGREPARQARAAEDDRIVARIRHFHAESGGTNGSPRIIADLREEGERVNEKRVARLMRVNGIVGLHLRNGKRTTIPDELAPPLPDLLNRDFSAGEVNQRWCGDITYLPVGDSWLYLATVIDIGSRRLVGWSIADHLRTELISDALTAVVRARGGHIDGVIFHSDRGCQGGFNWSSQHLNRRGGCCGAGKGACGDCGWSSAASVAGTAAGQSARGAAAVLAADR
jgi:transposase InsO family protein